MENLLAYSGNFKHYTHKEISSQFPIEARVGTYALILKVEIYSQLTVGSLGTLQVKPGYYIYVGSAFGPGGLKGRLAHHVKQAQKPHWHIDYLRQVAEVQEIWLTYDPIQREHEWARVLQTSPSAQVPYPGFGSSDCTCISHLIYFDLLYFTRPYETFGGAFR